MTARHHRDLACWQLAHQLKREVYAITASAQASRDRGFCDQVRQSGLSAPSNIAEGFWRYRPREFARFLGIARGSIGETQNHLEHALDQAYLSREEFDRIWNLAERAMRATSRLQSYLLRCSERPRTKNQEP